MNQLFDARMRDCVNMVEQELKGCFAEKNAPYQPLLDAMAYSLLSGGKRIRGVLVVAFCDLFTDDARAALPFAAALEMIHAYSLIHDDLPCMDDDAVRRGKPSCHIAFGESTALLAGDALQTMAFAACTRAEIPPQAICEAVAVLAGCAGTGGMVGGQVMDLANENKKLTAAELDAINDHKTGALFRAAARMGSIAGGADEQGKQAAEVYATHIGRAFQITDDLLDITADPAKLGKPVGSDAENDKNTYAALFGAEKCRALVNGHIAQAKQALALFGERAQFLQDLADMLGSREY